MQSDPSVSSVHVRRSGVLVIHERSGTLAVLKQLSFRHSLLTRFYSLKRTLVSATKQDEVYAHPMAPGLGLSPALTSSDQAL